MGHAVKELLDCTVRWSYNYHHIPNESSHYQPAQLVLLQILLRPPPLSLPNIRTLPTANPSFTVQISLAPRHFNHFDLALPPPNS